ncbi:hypothetical protein, variant [Cryptococcus amylolentus CBS 6039]|uniref:Phytocyanin domain-containing protein n=2 Tax=Cryptococcus amylolentus TaxID=104669 RepID=A0A1E3HGG5_9TREE|nr:hypothetical protein L202_06582 [Cryptococcus amylolentus CBS 6039]XP_018991082.1 hypothetical protein, variant [Cryptococcus amylolentus CBS 6039]ODN75431.1 hypothetical protein L202_06582 [Cryptococcus amylolentus CBS 6039]ODN75432.1 hypothetical protein, variant [Cryptococcus amylolentus CBS 6039]ODO03164.1 hypothetical protein I350_06009 [Cryptococcus amylolentus CBS 6273]
MFTSSLVALAIAATSVLGANHTVLVGQNSTKTFTPSELTAAVGDTVEFQFVGGNHTVTQSTFANPCTNSGFKSGFVKGNASNPTSFTISINDTTPLWMYCGQTGHCEAGMVMSINAPSTDKTFAAFQAAAAGNSSSTDSSSSSNSTATASASSTKTKNKNKDKSSSTASETASGTGGSSTASAAADSASSAAELQLGIPGVSGLLMAIAALAVGTVL